MHHCPEVLTLKKAILDHRQDRRNSHYSIPFDSKSFDSSDRSPHRSNPCGCRVSPHLRNRRVSFQRRQVYNRNACDISCCKGKIYLVMSESCPIMQIYSGRARLFGLCEDPFDSGRHRCQCHLVGRQHDAPAANIEVPDEGDSQEDKNKGSRFVFHPCEERARLRSFIIKSRRCSHC